MEGKCEGKCEIMSSLLILLHTDDPTTTSDHMKLPLNSGSQSRHSDTAQPVIRMTGVVSRTLMAVLIIVHVGPILLALSFATG